MGNRAEEETTRIQKWSAIRGHPFSREGKALSIIDGIVEENYRMFVTSSHSTSRRRGSAWC